MIDCSGIYILQFEGVGDYIGSSQYVSKRIKYHINMLLRMKHDNYKLRKAYSRCGELGIKTRLLIQCRKQDLLMYEQLAIDAFSPSLNISKCAGKVDSEILSKSMKERWNDPIARKLLSSGNAMRGKKHTPESKLKMSKSIKIAWQDEDFRKRQSLNRIGNKNRLSIPHDEATKAHLSAVLKGRPSPMLGIKHTNASKQKISLRISQLYDDGELRQKRIEQAKTRPRGKDGRWPAKIVSETFAEGGLGVDRDMVNWPRSSGPERLPEGVRVLDRDESNDGMGRPGTTGASGMGRETDEERRARILRREAAIAGWSPIGQTIRRALDDEGGPAQDADDRRPEGDNPPDAADGRGAGSVGLEGGGEAVDSRVTAAHMEPSSTQQGDSDDMTIVIESGVPLPTGRGRASNGIYPWDDLNVGDSFALPGLKAGSVGSMTAKATKDRAPKRFTYRTLPDGVCRVWRTA